MVNLTFRYGALYRSAKEGTPEKEEYYGKYTSYQNQLPGMRVQIAQAWEEVDLSDLENLQSALKRLQTDFATMEYSMENSIRPLTEDDYKEALAMISLELENAAEQQEHW